MKAPRKERFTYKRVYGTDPDFRPEEVEDLLAQLVAQAYLAQHPELIARQPAGEGRPPGRQANQR